MTTEWDEQKWLADNINQILALGIGRVQPCSGCHETIDGYETGHYPFSKTFKCYIGSGCDECFGVGMVEADYTDYPLWEENKKLQAENKKLREGLELILNNYEKCNQNPHNPPVIRHSYLNKAREILNELDKEGRG